MSGCTSRLLPEGPFAAKWHLNRSQFGRLLPDHDGIIISLPINPSDVILLIN